MSRFSTGDILFNKYRIERLVARGGFAEVYLAVHQHLNVPRALKVLTRQGGVTTGVLSRAAQRFQLEAQFGGQFANEPHLVRVYDFEWNRQDDLLVLVMEYLPGGSLKDHIRQARDRGEQGLPIEFVLRTAYHAALGLAALHKNELVHRDIKPSNILYDGEGRAKVADLGVAQMPHGLTRRTVLGSKAPRHPGTSEYMSPEQENTIGYLRPASDIYSLGLTLFEALTLRKYKHLRPGTRASQLRPDVPAWFDDLVMRMLASDPAKRPWDGEELARMLAPYVKRDTLPISRGHAEKRAKAQKAGKRSVLPVASANVRGPKTKTPRQEKMPASRWLLWGGGAGLVLLLLVWGLVNWFGDKNPVAGANPPSTVSVIATSILTATPIPPSEHVQAPLSLTNVTQIKPIAARQTKGAIHSVAWSSDGKLLAAASSRGVFLYDAQTLERVHFWQSSTPVQSVAFSPDATFVAVGLYSGTIQLWRVSGDRLVRSWRGHAGSVNSVLFSPDGALLASGSEDHTVKLWHVADGTLVRTLKGHTRDVRSVAFVPDGTILASGSEDHTVKLWRVSSGVLVQTLKGHADGVTSVAFSPDGTILASGAKDHAIRLWRVSDGTLMRVLDGHAKYVESVTFSPDGTLLASGSRDHAVRLWRVSDGVVVYNGEEHAGWVWSVAFAPDGVLLASGASDGIVRLWGVP